MINSPTLESDSSKHLCFSINPINENFDDINNNHYQQDKASFDCNNIMKQDILSSNDTTLLTTTTTTMTTVEFKVKTTKTSSRKRKLNIINENNNDNINKQQTITKKKVIYRKKTIEAQKIERKFNLYFSFTHAASPRDNDILMCACVCSPYLLFFMNIYSRTAALFLLLFLLLSYVCLLFVVVQYLS